jgi:O-antigen/teichoic acid export membrane protein
MGFSRTIVRNTVSTYLRFVIVLLVTFLTFPFMMSKLGLDVFGIYRIFWAIAAYLVLLDLGFSSAIVKYVARCRATDDWKDLNKIISTIFVIYLFFAVVSLFISGGIILALPLFKNFRELSPAMLANARLAFVMLGLNIAILLVLNTFKGILMGVQRLDLVNFAEGFINVLYGIAIFAFIRKPEHLFLATASFTVATFMMGFAYVIITFRVLPQVKISLRLFDRSRLSELFSFSFAAVILRVAVMFALGTTDQLILGVFATFATVTFYGIALLIADKIRTFVDQTSSVFEPFVSELHSTDRKEYLRKLYLVFTKMCFSVGLPIVVLAMVFGQPFIIAWTPEAKAEPVVPWLLGLLLIVALLDLVQISGSKVLLMAEKHWYQTLVWIITSLVIVALSIIAAIVLKDNTHKMLGIAVVKVVCIAALFVIIVSYTIRHVAASWRDFFAKCILPVILAIIPAALVAVTLRIFDYPLVMGVNGVNRKLSFLHIGWQGSVAGIIYLVTWWFIVLNGEERGKFKSLLRGFVRSFRRSTPQ